MADFSKPATIDTYVNVLAYLKATISDLALMMDPANTTPTNVPTNAIRWSSANNRFEKYNGTAWAALSTSFAFQDITASGNFSAAGSVTFSGGSANGVPYLNGSNVMTTGAALTFDGTNFATTGSATAASFAPTSSTVPTNGMYLPAASTLGWSLGSSESMRLTSNGLGVGTSSPSARLDVNGVPTASTPVARFLGNNGGGTVQNLTGLQYYWNLSAGSSESSFVYGNAAGSYLTFGKHNGTSYAETMRLDSSGNLGLGGTPSAWGSSYKALEFGNGNSGNIAFNGGQDGHICTNAYWDGTAWKYKFASNAVMYAPASNGTHQWFNATSGTAGASIAFNTAMTLDASSNLTVNGAISDATATLRPLVAASSLSGSGGTVKDFTSIPSWVQRITVQLFSLSTNGSANLILQLGTSVGFVTSGYAGGISVGNNAIFTANMSSGFDVSAMAATSVVQAKVVLTKIPGNTWMMSGIAQHSNTTTYSFSAGSVSLPAVLDRVRLTTVGGTNLFDSVGGAVNIMYE